jgi:hypothetical protein
MLEKTLIKECILFSRHGNLRQYHLENDEEFYKGVITTFSMKVSSMGEFKRKEEDFPSVVHKAT